MYVSKSDAKKLKRQTQMNSTHALAGVYAAMEQPIFTETVVITPRPNLIEGIPDYFIALFAPIFGYWVYALFFHFIDVYELAEQYRIHPLEEEVKRNKVTLHEVVRDVILQHVIQTVAGCGFYYLESVKTTGHELELLWRLRHSLPALIPLSFIYFGYYYAWPMLKLLAGITIIDTWQYWLHRLMHENKALYRRFHLRHHRLYVPYAYGALYNDPLEGFLLDTLGAGIAQMLCKLTARECILLCTFQTLKTVDDHLGYRLPWDPLQMIFPNNTVYHDIHHQQWGIKNNFLQPFFVFWDKLFGTDYKFIAEYKEKQNEITLRKYREFLATKDRSKLKKTE